MKTRQTIIVIVAITFLVSFSVGLAGIDGEGSGLVAHYKFDEGSGTVANDSSGNSNNATLSNGTAWTAGTVGIGALTFDGVDDYAENNTIFGAVPTALTLSAWVKWDTIVNNSGIAGKKGTNQGFQL